MLDYILIIVGLLVAIGGLIYQNDIEVKRAYQKGFERGLCMKVYRMSNDNDCDVIGKDGHVYKKDSD